MLGTVQVDPGIYPGVKFDEYSEWAGINFSSLRHFGKTPAHAHYEAGHQKDTASKDFGHMVHTVVLEPESLSAEYIVAPKVDRRTKKGKAAWAAFEARAEGRIIVKEDDFQKARSIVLNIRDHMTIRELLAAKGHNELSMVWEDPEFGVLCKGRIDRLCEFNGVGWIVDIKTHGHPASTHSFQKAVADYGYHEQMSFYRRGLEVLRPLPDGAPPRKSAWLVAESQPPNCVRLFESEDAALEMGADKVAEHLSTYSRCMETGVWPAWDQGMEVAGLPAWAYKRFGVD